MPSCVATLIFKRECLLRLTTLSKLTAVFLISKKEMNSLSVFPLWKKVCDTDPQVLLVSLTQLIKTVSSNGMIPLWNIIIDVFFFIIVVVDGYLIPKDCTIISNMGSMHTNAERYENPFEFVPERFLDNLKTMQASANGNIEQRDTYNFGWGRRICPGIYLVSTLSEV